MIRILMVVHEMNRGGIENFIMNLYRTIDRDSIRFDFVVHINEKCAFDDDIESLGGKIYHCPDYRIINHFDYSRWWNNFFKEHNEYKIIHSHLDSSANVHLRIAKRYGLTTIAHSHSSSEGFGIRAMVKAILKVNFNQCCDYRLACSQKSGKWLFGKKEFEVINNGIESSKYIYNIDVRNELMKEIGIPNNELVIGHVGRIDKNKNQSFVIDVIKELNNMNISTSFLSVGSGIGLESLKEKSKKLGLENKVMFLGLRNDVSKIVQCFSIFVMPSIYEGVPVSAIEAQASGLKCLMSDTISKETDVTGNVEFMSLEKSPKEWAEKIVSMLPYERKNTQQKIIDAGYDIKSTAEWLTDFYIKLAEKN